ncbi:MAG: Lrp/AsnC family transcriptional regulator [Acholeplasmatales bacterium]|nr:Lrp/AsnC family transcriptional regulator [Acholeplasmatales bacterium]
MNETLRERILKHLEKNSRIDLHDLAVMLGLSDVELANEIANMEKEHIICGYTTLVNWDNTDKEIVTALIEVKVTPQRGMGFETLADRIAKFPEVTSVYLMSGGFDFMVMIEGKSMKEVSRFVFEKLSVLETVLSTSTHFVLKKYKDHGVQLSDEKKDERMMVSA